jgi:hypothetical protein
MARARLGGWVIGGALLLLAGCATSDIFQLSSDSDGERLVAGRLDVVAQSTKSSLEQIGLVVSQTNRDDGVVWLQGAAPSGARFTVLLKRKQTEHGEQTVINVQWTGTRDEQTHSQIMARFASQSR